MKYSGNKSKVNKKYWAKLERWRDHLFFDAIRDNKGKGIKATKLAKMLEKSLITKR